MQIFSSGSTNPKADSVEANLMINYYVALIDN